MLFLFSPAVIYIVGAIIRFSDYLDKGPYADLWKTLHIQNLVTEVAVILVPLIISAVLFYFANAKRKVDVIVIFQIWLVVSALVSIFWTSLIDGVILQLLYGLVNLSLTFIYLSYVLYIAVVVFFLVDTTRILKNKNLKEVSNETN